MVVPLILAGAAAGAGGAGLGMALSGGGNSQKQIKKDVQVSRTYQPTTNTTVNRSTNVQKTISPQVSRTINYNPQVQIDSPSASIGSKVKQAHKKSAAPTQKNPVTLPVVQRPTGGQQRTGGQGQQAKSSGGGNKQLFTLGLIGLGALWVMGQ